MRHQTRSNLLMLLDWAFIRGPRILFLRIATQAFRIVTGRPLYRYSKILDQLYLGGQHRRWGWASMQAQGISAVVNMRRSDDRARGVASEHYLHLPTIDNFPPSIEQLQQGAAFIHQQIAAGRTVYVHCGVGVGRAPTMVAAYLVSTGMHPSEAWDFIRQRRPLIFPLWGQIRQVERFAELYNTDDGASA